MFSCDDMKTIDDIFYNFQCIPGVKSGIRRDFLFEDYVIKNGITYLYDSNLCFCVARDMLKQNIVKKVLYIDTVNSIECIFHFILPPVSLQAFHFFESQTSM